MNRIAIFFLIVVAPLLAILLAVLGVKTIPTNGLGWFLLLVGVVYPVGLVIVYIIRKEHFFESRSGGVVTHEERGDRSFWLITAGMLVSFYIPPVEYLYFAPVLGRSNLTKGAGILLVILGVILFTWARLVLGKFYSGHVSVEQDQKLVQSGPYGVLRHPAYAGYLLMALGICTGYSSLAGLTGTLFVLLPGLVYRIRVEEKLLEEKFGDKFKKYASRSKRLIPGIW